MNKNILKICLVLFTIFVSKELFSQTMGNNNRLGVIVNNIIEKKPIVLISQLDNYILYSDVNSYNLFLYNKTNRISKEIIISEINVDSTRLIKFMNITIAEIIGSSNMGNGNLYLFDTDLNILLQRYYVNGHMEMWEYDVFIRMEQFKNREFVYGESISEIFRNYALSIDYNFNGENIIRIYGIHDYISEIGERHEIILSENIDEKYIYSKNDNKFILLENSNK